MAPSNLGYSNDFVIRSKSKTVHTNGLKMTLQYVKPRTYITRPSIRIKRPFRAHTRRFRIIRVVLNGTHPSRTVKPVAVCLYWVIIKGVSQCGFRLATLLKNLLCHYRWSRGGAHRWAVAISSKPTQTSAARGTGFSGRVPRSSYRPRNTGRQPPWSWAVAVEGVSYPIVVVR